MPDRLNRKPKNSYSAINPASRERDWLGSHYGDHKLSILSTAGEDAPITVDFDVKMADGRSLLEHPKLYATAKEFFFWIRAGNYTNIESARRHEQYTSTIISICYALTSRKIDSFDKLTIDEIDDIVAQASYGKDNLVNISEVVKANLSALESWDDVPKHFIKRGVLDAAAIRDELALPESWSRQPVKKEVAAATARLNGELLASAKTLTNITQQNVSLYTSTFEALYFLKHLIEAPTIRMRPFLEGAARRAIELGRESERTPIPPPELALKFMEASAKVVVSDGPRVVKAYQALLARHEQGQVYQTHLDELMPEMQRVFCACYVIVSAFTARRTSEIKRTPHDCLKGDNRRGWWMKVYIAKTQRDYSWIPVPDVVALAVRILRGFSNSSICKKEQKLFTYYSPRASKHVSPIVERHIDGFAEYVEAKEYLNEKNAPCTWKWVTRQFRRFFAVLFIYRYRGKMETLAHQLRHFDLQVTNDYVTLDPENARIWSQEIWNFQISIARSVAAGESEYVGPLADQLKKLAARLMKIFGNIHIIPETLAKAIAGNMSRNQYFLTPKLWVTCACPRTQGGCARAACRKLSGTTTGIGPDFSEAGPTVCPGCPFAIFDQKNLAYIDEEIETLTRANMQTAGETSIFAELQAANVVVLSDYRDKLRGSSKETSMGGAR